MQIVHTIAEVREHVARARKEGKRVGFVPTMGFLHRGHLSLVEESKKYAGYQVMSIFVNPAQFGPAEDFSKYPRPFNEDCRLAAGRGCDIVFAPSATATVAGRTLSSLAYFFFA